MTPPAPAVHTVEVNGLTIACRQAGNPDGRPVVLLHGMSSTGASWDRFAADLAAAGYRVFAPDLRGHGGSGRSSGGYPFAGFRDDVLGLLDRFGLDRVSLVGHSLGGHIASRVAQHQPERVERLVIEDSPAPPRTGDAAAVRRSLQLGPSMVLRSGLIGLAGLRRLRTFDRRMTRPMIEQFRTPDPLWWDRLPAITAPTLLISGGPTSHVSGDQLAEVAGILPRGTFTVIAVGHRVHSTRPAEFSRTVLPFLA